MRIGCLQFAPEVGDVDDNISKAEAILDKADPKDLDLLVLPELAFSGKLKPTYSLPYSVMRHVSSVKSRSDWLMGSHCDFVRAGMLLLLRR